jgi:hypothetical protein
MASWTAYARTGFLLGHVEAEDAGLARSKADAHWPNEVAVLVESHPHQQPRRGPRHHHRHHAGRPR